MVLLIIAIKYKVLRIQIATIGDEVCMARVQLSASYSFRFTVFVLVLFLFSMNDLFMCDSLKYIIKLDLYRYYYTKKIKFL